MDRDERVATGREGRSAFANAGGQRVIEGGSSTGAVQNPRDDLARMAAVAPPPGADDINYASLAGN
jgi:pre-mRNA-splicing factor RBM22/SLT11